MRKAAAVRSAQQPGVNFGMRSEFAPKIVGPAVTSLVAFPAVGHRHHGIRSDAVQWRKTEEDHTDLRLAVWKPKALGRQDPYFLGGASEFSHLSIEGRDARRSGSR